MKLYVNKWLKRLTLGLVVKMGTKEEVMARAVCKLETRQFSNRAASHYPRDMQGVGSCHLGKKGETPKSGREAPLSRARCHPTLFVFPLSCQASSHFCRNQRMSF